MTRVMTVMMAMLASCDLSCFDDTSVYMEKYSWNDSPQDHVRGVICKTEEDIGKTNVSRVYIDNEISAVELAEIAFQKRNP